MARAIYFNIPSSGHINPTVPVMQLLADSDIEIIYVSAEENRQVIEQTGVRFVAYPADATTFHNFFANVTTENFAANAVQLLKCGNELMPFCLDLIETEKPDVIINDSLASWGKVAAQINGLPRLAISTTFIISGSAGLNFPLRYLLLFAWQMLRAVPAYLEEATMMRNTYKIKPLSLPELLMASADENIVFTSKSFQPDTLSKDYFEFVGAAIGERASEVEFTFDLIRDDVPVVYISMGTIAKNNAFIQRCFTAFEALDVQFILSVGKQTDIASLGTPPQNFIVRNYVPQLDILERVDAFITHGGMNSVQEGFLHGVPLVVVPQQAEQGMVAKQVVANGAGIGLQMQPPYGNVSVEELRDALTKILGNLDYAKQAKQLGEDLRAAGGAARAAKLIEQFAIHKTIQPISD